MIPFLKSIAKAYASRYPDISEFCFLFPNKRSGTFFLKYLKEECGLHLMLSPEVKTISQFVEELSGRTVASRIDQLFLLFESYRELMGMPADGSDKDDGVDFDSFRSWGETVLSDFSEIDQYLVDADEIFKNVKDYREISSNFLTEEQKRVMVEYFGRNDYGDPSRFWKNFDDPEENLSEVKRRFLHLWRVMAPLYHSLNDKLALRGLCTSGGGYRLALAALREKGRESLPFKKIVIVGFNALSASEHAIFSELRDFEGYNGYDCFADFYWDMTGPVLAAGINSASKFVKSNIKVFPQPEWSEASLRLSDNNIMPRIRVASSPSNSAQTKITGTMLSELRGRLTSQEINDARVAVVLPDENLLLPMLYSLPEGMGDVNLTMGYSLRLTSVASFVSLLRRLMLSARQDHGNVTFYHHPLRVFLAHPFSHALFGTLAIESIYKYIDYHHKNILTLKEIVMLNERVASMINPALLGTSPEQAISHLDFVLAEAAASLSGVKDGMTKSRLEISHINVYRDGLRRFVDVVKEYGIGMKANTAFRLADSLMAGEKVGFEGEPLTGLQVMGTLETRSIDFDYLFILSMNEKIMPRRARSRSFIPDSLRHAYAMPPSNYAEGIFAYYFFRMISRAKEVTLLYDGRSGSGMGGGDVSRYILQLKHLFAKGSLEEQDWKFLLAGKMPHDATVEKNPDIMSRLDAFMEPGGHHLSSSSLNAYRECQVKFYYKHVLGLNDDQTSSDYIDPITAGNILHSMMLQLYLPESLRGKYLDKPVVVTADDIRAMLRDKEKIDQLLTRTVNACHFHLDADKLDTPLTGAARIIGMRIKDQILNVLRRDLSLCPLRIWGGEISETLRVTLKSGRTVNLKFIIDRLDEATVDGHPELRIVDYKTGTIKLEAESVGEMFKGGYKSEQIFQLFTYAWLLEKRNGDNAAGNIVTEIYDVPHIMKSERSLPEIDGKNVEHFGEYSAEFSEAMENMIEDIFTSPNFHSPSGDEACRNCSFRDLCKK